jgi:hypothetical protein
MGLNVPISQATARRMPAATRNASERVAWVKTRTALNVTVKRATATAVDAVTVTACGQVRLRSPDETISGAGREFMEG